MGKTYKDKREFFVKKKFQESSNSKRKNKKYYENKRKHQLDNKRIERIE